MPLISLPRPDLVPEVLALRTLICLLFHCNPPSDSFNHTTNIHRTTFGASEMESATPVTRKSGREIKKTLKLREQDDCIPIAVQPLPKPVKKAMQDPLPQFEPVFRVAYEPPTSSIVTQDPLSLFMLFFTEFCFQTIVAATNTYASRHTQNPTPQARP